MFNCIKCFFNSFSNEIILSDNNSTFLYPVNDFLKNTNQNREN